MLRGAVVRCCALGGTRVVERRSTRVLARAVGGQPRTGHAHHSMPGMATTEQLDELATAKGADVDRLYLDLMIAHHEGALKMCKTLGEKGSDERTGELGDDIHVTQTKQISQMKDMRRRL